MCPTITLNSRISSDGFTVETRSAPNTGNASTLQPLTRHFQAKKPEELDTEFYGCLGSNRYTEEQGEWREIAVIYLPDITFAGIKYVEFARPLRNLPHGKTLCFNDVKFELLL